MLLGKFGETLRKKRKEKKGFTLLELIIVIAIIAILLALLVPNMSKILGNANKTSKNANVKTMYTSASTWAAELATEEVTVVTGTVKISDAGVVDMGSTTIPATKAASLKDYINKEKLATEVVISISEDYSISKVTYDGGQYPEKDEIVDPDA